MNRGSRGVVVFAAGLLAFGVLIIPLEARSQTTMLDDFGGPLGFGTECLSHNDDGSSAVIDITPYFPDGLQFFDSVHTTLHVNTNGNITFNGPLSTYTPDPFPVAAQPMIAPYWADVDIRTMFGECWGGGGTSEPGDLGCENPPENGVWWWFEPGRLVVTWDRVGYYNCEDDLRMSFQLVITSVQGCAGSGDFDVEFRYNRCEWHTGAVSDVAAQAGFDAGNEQDYVEIPGSRTDNINQILCTDSNVEEPGIWKFQIRAGQILCPEAGVPCKTDLEGACAEGLTQCTGVDLTERECIPVVQPVEERCDAVDNDCDGEVDEGDAICDGFEVCDRGHCVDRCSEFGCPEDQVCGPDGLCIYESCIGVVCEPGERCEFGECFGACDGVVCPAGQICSSGRCTDPCETLTCDDCTVCVDGACVPRCQFSDCPQGEACLEDGRCVVEACADVDCGQGTTCVDGLCLDACDGVACPHGEICEAGECVPEPEPDVEPLPQDSEDGDFAGGDEPFDDGTEAEDSQDDEQDDAAGVEVDEGPMIYEPGSASCKPTIAGRNPQGDSLLMLLTLGALFLLRRR